MDSRGIIGIVTVLIISILIEIVFHVSLPTVTLLGLIISISILTFLGPCPPALWYTGSRIPPDKK
jgi:hypothetical protein